MGNRQAAETTRQAALTLGIDADHGDIIGWAHEIRAWINLTGGTTTALSRRPGPGPR